MMHDVGMRYRCMLVLMRFRDVRVCLLLARVRTYVVLLVVCCRTQGLVFVCPV